MKAGGHDRRTAQQRAAIAATLLVFLASAFPFARQTAPVYAPGSFNFTVFLRAVPLGAEQTKVERTADGWTITSSGRIGAPVDLVAQFVQVRYTEDWNPVDLTIDALLQGQPLIHRTSISGGTATSTFTQAGQSGQRSDPIAADAVLLPSPFFGPFEALAARLKRTPAGATIPAYSLLAPYNIEVGQSTDETIDLGTRAVRAQRTRIRVIVPGNAPLDAEVWLDENGHLLRWSVPSESLEVVREDIASVSARRVVVSRAGDETVRIPANGFSLTGTISKPATAVGRPVPAVVLVAGSGSADRDEATFGIPIFGQLAGMIADAGFLVLRYDKRGVGQSGGRAEAATLGDYSEDLRAAVKFMSNRKDVERKKLALVGHGEGGAVAMLAASKDNKVTAVVLVDAPGASGADLNLEQVRHSLARGNKPEAEKAATLELQQKIQQAVLTGAGWEGIAPTLRRQAETPWFQSFLAFDPAKPMRDMRQPILVVQAMLDTQVPPVHAERLEQLAKARKKGAGVDVAKIPDVNHLLVPATTGEIDEYTSLADKQVSPAVGSAITGWLAKTFGSRSF